MQKKVSLIQPNFRHGPTWLNIYFLPYSVGCIWSYADAQPDIHAQYCLDQVIWRRDNIEDLAQRIKDNSVVAFSTYVWNRKYNYALAKRLKELNPMIKVVFGGPEPPITDPDIFRKHPYIDMVIVQEGELVFAEVLRNINGDLKQTPGLLLNCDGEPVGTGESQRIEDLAILPSPYLTGFFDSIVADNPGITWNVTIETVRGCPYQCTFCDWGGLTYNKVKKMPMDRIFAEIDWCGKYGNGLYIADANFGMFIDRDREIIDKIVEVQKEHGLPDLFYTSWAKNQKTDVVDLMSRLGDTLSNGLTVSVQSLTPEVLDIIKRTNLKQHKIQEIFDLARERNVVCYTELILGLPGETYESFQESVFEIFRAGNHHSIEINQSQMLENAEMNVVQREIYDIQTTDATDYLTSYWTPELGPEETVMVVNSTSTLPRNRMVDLLVWTSFIHAFHFYGFSTQLSRFVYRYYNQDYKEFYKKLLEHLEQDPYFQTVYQRMHEQFHDWFEHGYLKNPMTQEITVNGVNIWMGVAMLINLESQVPWVWNQLTNFMRTHYDLPDNILQDLMKYQRETTLTMERLGHGVDRKVDFKYNIQNYIEHGDELDQPVSMKFSLKDIQRNLNEKTFYESIFLRRRQRIGLINTETRVYELQN